MQNINSEKFNSKVESNQPSVEYFWGKLGLTAESKRTSFEDLCLFLWCRELGISSIDAYNNQKGIETKPFIDNNGKRYGFQAKFFDSGFEWAQIIKSIARKENKKVTDADNLAEQYPDNVFKIYRLNKLYIYTNKNTNDDSNNNKKTKSEELLDSLAKIYKADIEYIGDATLKVKLNQPSNLDLAQFYFGLGDELGFIRNSINPKWQTFIQSRDYTHLKITDSKKEPVNVNNLISTNNVCLLIGHAGSGKSILMQKLLQVFGGLEEKNEAAMIKVLTDNQAVPILVNLKNCAINSLEIILRDRKNDSKVNSQTLGFIYLLDGLDELNEVRADAILHEMLELSWKKDTKNIIISCRSGNINRLKAKSYFTDSIEYRIADLTRQDIDDFFKHKQDSKKIEKLDKLPFIKDIKDILSVTFLWETIEQLHENSSIIDIFHKKVDLLLSAPEHKKHIDGLNILNPKKTTYY